MRVIGLTVGPIQENAYVLGDEASGACAVIDPGAEPERILQAARAVAGERARVTAVLLTHAHLDHVGAVAPIRDATGARVWLHPDDLPLYRSAPEQARSFGWTLPAPPEPDRLFAEGVAVEVGPIPLWVRHAPGHSPGHVVLVGDGLAFVGDCVFAGSIGRSDLPGGDQRTLLRSIERTILPLAGDTVLYPGHGPETTVARERATNPFLIGLAPDPRCLRCGEPVPEVPRRCRIRPCPNCGYPQPLGGGSEGGGSEG